MFTPILTGSLLIALVVQTFQTRRKLKEAEEAAAGIAANARQDADTLTVELATRWREEVGDDALAVRRAVGRIQLLAHWMGLPDDISMAAQLAISLPESAILDRRIALPAGIREVAHWRRASADARNAAAATVPMAAQLVIMVDWLDAWRGQEPEAIREALRGDAGMMFARRLVDVVLAEINDLVHTVREDHPLAGPAATGMVLCVQPDFSQVEAAERAALLRTVEERLRQTLRPGDRVYSSENDVVAWLPSAKPGDVDRVIARVSPTLGQVPHPGRGWGRVNCRLAPAVIGDDGQRLPDLVAAARKRLVATEQDTDAVAY